MRRINLEALHYYLSYKHVPTPLSMFAGEQRQPSIDLSWLKFVPVLDMPEEKIIAKLDSMLRDYIGSNLQGNWGCFTSGGIDSGVVTAIAAQLYGKPIKTFSMIYADETEGKRMDREYSELISKMYKTEHYQMTLRYEDFPQVLPEIIRCFGEPFSGYISVYFLAGFAKKYIDIALTGDWGDELFASYRTHRLAYKNPTVDLWRLRYAGMVFNDEEQSSLCEPWVQERCGVSTAEHLKGYFKNITAKDSLNQMLESEFHSLFVDQTYKSIDVLSRAQKLEIKGMYGRPDIVDLCNRTPIQLKMKDGETKYILKKLALKYLPEKIAYRPKEGFITPTFPLVKKLEAYVRGMLSMRELQKHNLFNIKYVHNLMDEFYKGGTEKQSYQLWNLVCFQVWYDLYFG